MDNIFANCLSIAHADNNNSEVAKLLEQREVMEGEIRQQVQDVLNNTLGQNHDSVVDINVRIAGGSVIRQANGPDGSIIKELSAKSMKLRKAIFIAIDDKFRSKIQQIKGDISRKADLNEGEGDIIIFNPFPFKKTAASRKRNVDRFMIAMAILSAMIYAFSLFRKYKYRKLFLF